MNTLTPTKPKFLAEGAPRVHQGHYDCTAVFNHLELPCEAEYEDTGTYRFTPKPEVTVTHLWVKPAWFKEHIDLLSDAYSWLLSEDDIYSYKTEIEGSLIQDFKDAGDEFLASLRWA